MVEMNIIVFLQVNMSILSSEMKKTGTRKWNGRTVWPTGFEILTFKGGDTVRGTATSRKQNHNGILMV